MISGPLLFARYAIWPNQRGYCGPADHEELRGYLAAGQAGPGLVRLAKDFAGAWPYLRLIAASSGITDPLDPRVVEAYWVGNDLLRGVRIPDFGLSLDERFRRRSGTGWQSVSSALLAGGVPHHSFHVFCVYPWTGLLRAGVREPSLEVLDRCRIGWGQVIALAGPAVVVRQRALTWDGRVFGLGEPSPRAVSAGFVPGLRPGDWVSLHWDCVCDRLSHPQLAALVRYTNQHMRLACQAKAARSQARVPLDQDR